MEFDFAVIGKTTNTKIQLILIRKSSRHSSNTLVENSQCDRKWKKSKLPKK